MFNPPNIYGLYPKHRNASLDNFIINKGNECLFEACKEISYPESITLTGNTGTGKTHLAVGIMKNLPPIELEFGSECVRRGIEQRLLGNETKKENESNYKKRPNYDPSDFDFTKENDRLNKMLNYKTYLYRSPRCLFLSAVQFFLEVSEASVHGKGSLSYFQELVTPPIIDANLFSVQISGGYDYICLDDLGAEKMSDFKRECLYYLIDERYKNELGIIVTSNYSIEQLDEVEPRITSRLYEIGKVLYFGGDDYRLKK